VKYNKKREKERERERRERERSESIFNFFYWRIIALQYSVGFCHTST